MRFVLVLFTIALSHHSLAYHGYDDYPRFYIGGNLTEYYTPEIWQSSPYRHPYIDNVRNARRIFKNDSISLIKDNINCTYGLKKDNKWVVEPIYDYIDGAVEGKAIINYQGLYGVIDLNNFKLIIPCEHKTLHWYSIKKHPDNSSWRSIDPSILIFGSANKYGLIDIKGDTIIPPIYSSITFYSNNMLYINVGDKTGVWFDGKERLKPEYEKLKYVGDSLFVFQKGNLEGVCNIDGKVIIKNSYDKIVRTTLNSFIVEKDSLLGLYDLSGNQLISVKYHELCPNFKGYQIYQTKAGYHILWEGKLIDKNTYTKVGSKFNFKYGEILVSRGEYDHPAGMYKNGKLLFEAKYTSIHKKDSNTYIVSENWQEYKTVDSTGKQSLPYIFSAPVVPYDTINSFIRLAHVDIVNMNALYRSMKYHEDYSPCNWGLMDMKGNVILEPDYCSIKYNPFDTVFEAERYSNIVLVNAKTGKKINENRIVSPFGTSAYNIFGGGYVINKSLGKYYVSDKRGNKVSEHKYDILYELKVEDDSYYDIHWGARYASVGYYVAKYKDKYGLLDAYSVEEVVNFEYDFIGYDKEYGRVILIKGDSVYKIDSDRQICLYLFNQNFRSVSLYQERYEGVVCTSGDGTAMWWTKGSGLSSFMVYNEETNAKLKYYELRTDSAEYILDSNFNILTSSKEIGNFPPYRIRSNDQNNFYLHTYNKKLTGLATIQGKVIIPNLYRQIIIKEANGLKYIVAKEFVLHHNDTCSKDSIKQYPPYEGAYFIFNMDGKRLYNFPIHASSDGAFIINQFKQIEVNEYQNGPSRKIIMNFNGDTIYNGTTYSVKPIRDKFYYCQEHHYKSCKLIDTSGILIIEGNYKSLHLSPFRLVITSARDEATNKVLLGLYSIDSGWVVKPAPDGIYTYNEDISTLLGVNTTISVPNYTSNHWGWQVNNYTAPFNIGNDTISLLAPDSKHPYITIINNYIISHYIEYQHNYEITYLDDRYMQLKTSGNQLQQLLLTDSGVQFMKLEDIFENLQGLNSLLYNYLKKVDDPLNYCSDINKIYNAVRYRFTITEEGIYFTFSQKHILFLSYKQLKPYIMPNSPIDKLINKN